MVKKKTHYDHVRDWISYWKNYSCREVHGKLVNRGIEPRHKEHELGEAKVIATRGWLFDWALKELKLAIEIDGGNYMVRWSETQHRHIPVGRHTKSSDYEKRNAAAEAGWTVLAFTTEMLDKNPMACVEQVERVVRRLLQ